MNKTYLYIIILTITLCSCVKYHCPGFADEDLKWIPYKINDTLFYSNGIDTVSFIVNNFYKTEPSNFREMMLLDYECEYKAYYSTNKIDCFGYKIKEEFNSAFSNWYIDTNYPMIIQLSDYDYFPLDPFFVYNPELKFENDTIDIIYYQDSIINNINYEEIYVLKKDTIKLNPRISRVIKSSTKGIIEFYDNYSKQKWLLIEK